MATSHTTPFDVVARDYDRIFSESQIGRVQRQTVWAMAARVFRPGQRILDLGCGTGVDAVYLARLGCNVLALDSSFAMVAVARERVLREGYQSKVQVQHRSIEELAALGSQPDFDGVLSNFGGFNCVANLAAVSETLSHLVKPGSSLLFCLLNRYCLWEVGFYAMCFRFDKAFRRWRGKGAVASLGPGQLLVYYPSARELCLAFQPHFRYVEHRAVGLAVPPSYLENWAQQHERSLQWAKRLDDRAGGWPLLQSLGDHYVAHLERR